MNPVVLACSVASGSRSDSAHDHSGQCELRLELALSQCRFPRLPQVNIEWAETWRPCRPREQLDLEESLVREHNARQVQGLHHSNSSNTSSDGRSSSNNAGAVEAVTQNREKKTTTTQDKEETATTETTDDYGDEKRREEERRGREQERDRKRR